MKVVDSFPESKNTGRLQSQEHLLEVSPTSVRSRSQRSNQSFIAAAHRPGNAFWSDENPDA